MATHTQIRAQRASRAAEPPPGPAALQIVALGSRSTAASFAWMRAVLAYGHRGDVAPEALSEWITASTELDPTWIPPHAYGALMLASIGDIEGHERILRTGVAAHPEDPWFPVALGMSRLLHSDDPRDAAAWLELASTLEGGDAIYARAADRLRGAP
ncbi:MAG: hypothetical protein KC912_16870 [Proteobacteria bacterium]|nr:hypothetical protein [Pseudomonadota bacterium]